MCRTDGKYAILTPPPKLTNWNLLSISFPQRKDVLKHHLSFHCSFPLFSLLHIIFDTVSRNWNQLTELTHLPSFLCSSVGKECAYNARDLGTIVGSGKSPGEGNGNPFQYSCLENPLDRGTWQAIVHGVSRVGHDWATSLFTLYIFFEVCIQVFCPFLKLSCFLCSWVVKDLYIFWTQIPY